MHLYCDQQHPSLMKNLAAISITETEKERKKKGYKYSTKIFKKLTQNRIGKLTPRILKDIAGTGMDGK